MFQKVHIDHLFASLRTGKTRFSHGLILTKVVQDGNLKSSAAAL
jgi:hypothetical protein